MIASIPNVRHHSVVRGLLAGDWTYEDAGLLDRTHLRFFTRRSIRDLFGRCGYDLDAVDAVPGPGDDAAARTRPAPARSTSAVCVSRGWRPEEAGEFFAYQYLVTARRGARPRRAVGAAARCRLRRSPSATARPTAWSGRSRPTPTRPSRPADKVLLDYGSTPPMTPTPTAACATASAGATCPSPRRGADWCLSDAYNLAVAALEPGVEVVFKNDVDVLLGEDVLAAAAERGRERLCLFATADHRRGGDLPGPFRQPCRPGGLS